ncbi:hypothetical protein CVT24_002710 [Panaeolus cyanescens]|uniref:Beta/gamma crystallin 'Greek key' domain-containing protein n=1 Tax=Panaeolus cyanescens TaxID=181874 RepID=A0A409YY87_9AGAR|nr:hypothetical protein CVT24_002710 [Panaeolus cyanescens]
MKFFTNIIAAAAVITSVSAWEFTGWADQNYSGDLVIYRSGNGLVNNLCVDIIQNDNRMSSFKWYRGTNIGCSMKLFDGHGCSGALIGSSTGNWNVAAISNVNNDRVSSLWVDCL